MVIFCIKIQYYLFYFKLIKIGNYEINIEEKKFSGVVGCGGGGNCWGGGGGGGVCGNVCGGGSVGGG